MFELSSTKMPNVVQAYSIIRHSTWQATDPNNILIYIREGRCFVELENKQFLLEQGDFIFIPKNAIYSRFPYKNENCTMVYIHFDDEVNQCNTSLLKNDIDNSAEPDNSLLAHKPSYYRLKNYYLDYKTKLSDKAELINSLIHNAFLLNTSISFYNNNSFSILLHQILSLISEKTISESFIKDTNSLSSIPERLRLCICYIEQHYFDNIVLEDLCNLSYTSKVQINRFFNVYFGTSPTNYIILFRINKARDLLQNCPNMSIKEISVSVGYQDQCYFSRLFTKVTGTTPTQFRARVINFDENKHIKEGLDK